MPPSERVAIYGGTFDPIHRGHVEALDAVFDRMEWSRVVLMPASTQPFKLGARTSSPFDRHAMAVLATHDDPRFEVSKLELERSGVSYTVDTLESLRASRPDSALDWVVGDDNLALLPQWKSLDRILELANFVVLAREGLRVLPPELEARASTPEGRGLAGSIVFAENPRIEVSATDIRRRVATGEHFEDFVDRRVAEYISRNRLYVTEDES
ncbi:MAG: nicotinate (nicotinamide) nucleotide adenylyltransferase [Acidobacteria bacterium]|nr:nicotinate (nicotinamide) nucleotide adenylyltransferase [Acidobacteriota bacterium]